MLWLILAGAILLGGIAAMTAIAWLRLGDLEDLLLLLLWRRVGKTPPPMVSQYSGRW